MKPRAIVTVSSYVIHFMGLNGIKNFEPSDRNTYSRMALKWTTDSRMRINLNQDNNFMGSTWEKCWTNLLCPKYCRLSSVKHFPWPVTYIFIAIFLKKNIPMIAVYFLFLKAILSFLLKVMLWAFSIVR